MIEPCDCCRWEVVDGGGDGLLLCSETSDTAASGLLYELGNRIEERLRAGGGVVLLGDEASVGLLDAANLDLAELLCDTTDEAMRRCASSGVAIGFNLSNDAAVSGQLEMLHSRGALTIAVVPFGSGHQRIPADLYVVIDTHKPQDNAVSSLCVLWRAVVDSVLASAGST